MILRVQHDTRYQYSKPICLDPHLFRLRPRADGSQRLIRFMQQIKPRPAGWTEFTDLEGNAAAEAWFEGSTDQLGITTEFVVETLRRNPFDFIITDPALLNLPVRYPDSVELTLGVYCQPSNAKGAVSEFAGGVAQEAGGHTLDFLSRLASRVSSSCRLTPRENGQVQPPDATLDLQAGTHRDLAVLFIESARSQGVAARYTTGYHHKDGSGASRHMHAWAEVYLPGAGWRGFDPTLGTAVADRHIPLASSLVPSGAAPVQGRFWGSDTTSTLRVNITIAPE